MARTNHAYDVFIAHDHRDSASAEKVAEVLASYNLSVFASAQQIPAGKSWEDEIWEAIAESHALVVIVPGDASSSWLAFELGAARAWNKPVYAVATDPLLSRFPYALQKYMVFPISRVDEIAQSIVNSKTPLSSKEQQYLVEAYQKTGIPVDQLALQPKHLQKLVRDFEKRSGKQASGEQVLSQLMRSRKQGVLQPLKRHSV